MPRGIYKRTQYHRDTISRTKKGTKYSPEARLRMNKASIGIPRSEETKRRISVSQIGKKLTQEHKNKLSIAHKLLPKKGRHIKTKEEQREVNLKSKFGLTLLAYQELVDKQNGVCGICNQKCTVKNYLSVDHNHATGKVRGLLCHHCNLSLGGFKDNVEYLKNAIKWLC